MLEFVDVKPRGIFFFFVPTTEVIGRYSLMLEMQDVLPMVEAVRATYPGFEAGVGIYASCDMTMHGKAILSIH